MIQELKRLLDNKISEETLVLHGTSIQAIFELGIRGSLPSGKIRVREDGNIEDIDSYGLWFTPVTSKLKGRGYTWLEDEEKDRDGCIESATSYAKGVAFIDYLAEKLNCRTAEAYSAIFYDWSLNWKEVGEEYWKKLKEKMEGLDVKTNLRQMAVLHHYANKRNGVIVEADESIFELPCNQLLCDTESIFVECPGGLDIRYIRGMKLLGPVEEKLMGRFLNGKLKYRGFMTTYAGGGL